MKSVIGQITKNEMEEKKIFSSFFVADVFEKAYTMKMSE